MISKLDTKMNLPCEKSVENRRLKLIIEIEKKLLDSKKELDCEQGDLKCCERHDNSYHCREANTMKA